MKAGDYVGWADTWSDAEGCDPAGIILEVEEERQEWNENYSRFLILMNHNGQLSWEYGSDLVVMFESR